MSQVFNRFSRAAREVVTAAAAEAAGRGDRRVGTEHLVLGLLHEADSPTARALGVDLRTARGALRAMDLEALAAVGVGLDTADLSGAMHARSGGRLPFTSAAKSALQRTLREAVRRKDRRLEPTHLLLALLACERPDPAADLLARLGVDRDVVRARLEQAA
ncbi:MAG: Clp protease N-terminal domain-containing protein [Actinomycetes bacterium]